MAVYIIFLQTTTPRIIMFILTEKPSVASDIANALGGFQKQPGFFQRNNDCIIYAAGHLLELFEPEDYNEKFSKWNILDLPIIPLEMKYKPIFAGKKQLYLIKDCFKRFSQNDFILATDPEREGELIGHLILQFCGFTNYQNAKRFWVAQALTPEVVKEGLANAKPLLNYSSYKEAGLARSQADWIIGINISRLLSLSSGNTLFSFGRVQTAVLGAIYLRENSIKNFKPLPYNQVKAVLDNFSLFLSDNKDTKIPPNGGLLEKVNQLSSSDYIKITDIQVQEKVEKAPELFNITGLQKYCAAQYDFSPTKTLEIAQTLYENLKVLSYPRTPSNVLGDDNVDLFLEKFNLLKDLYPEFSKDCDVQKISSDNKRIFNSKKLQDHHALIPLGELPQTATDEQRKVFNAVLERFFNLIKPDYIYNSINITGTCKDLEFIGNGKQVLQQGFKDCQKPPFGGLEDSEKNLLEQVFPNINIGDSFNIKELKIADKFTKPKPHFTNTSLLALMENPKNDEKRYFLLLYYLFLSFFIILKFSK